ncbi:MAG: FecR domain-containing protein [Alistipes sp.]
MYINDRINATTAIDVEQSLKLLKKRMSARRRNPMHTFHRMAWKAVAAVAMTAALVSGIWVTASLSERISRPCTVMTQLGERSQVVLPDGSKVWLNSCSRVEFHASLFSRERHVSMTGEAYFEVHHDKNSPFTVSTNGLDIEVLGTKFNIRNDEDKHLVTTVLLEGSVLAHPTDSDVPSARMRPSQQLAFNTQTQHMHLSSSDTAERSINWIDGRFQFEQSTFEEIVAELKRYYNVDIRFMDAKLKNERFSGDFKVEDGIYHIMSILQLTYKFHYKIDRNDILLYAN